MSHRVINNIGYKKIYPMSLFEDDSFCHYCGRQAGIDLRLEWDHVPALNVTIPEYMSEIKKTLVRSCNECNNLASDTPHLDYLERHFWLKGAYLRRYKSLIVSDAQFAKKSKDQDDFINAVIENSKEKYNMILSAIGFGIKNIENIESPILKVKTKMGRKVENVLIEYLVGIPTEEIEEDDTPSELPTKVSFEEDIGNKPYSLDEFIDFLVAEAYVGNRFSDNKLYGEWYQKHPGRVDALELPRLPDKHIGVTWQRFNEIVNMKLSEDSHTFYKEELNDVEIDHDINDEEDSHAFYKEELNDVEIDYDVSDEEEYKKFKIKNEFCTLKEFVTFLSENLYEDEMVTEEAYNAWCRHNPYMYTSYQLPLNPTSVYECSWSEIVSFVENCL